MKTYADYAATPEYAPVQLIEGEFVHTPARTPRHQQITARIGMKIYELAQARGDQVFFVPVDVYLSDLNVFTPDIVYLQSSNLHLIGELKIEGAPDLIVEVLSSPTTEYDVGIKKDWYEKSGVKEYWIVDPLEKSVEVLVNQGGQFQLFARAEGKEKLRSKLLPEFTLELPTLFD